MKDIVKKYSVLSNHPVGPKTYLIRLKGDTSLFSAQGQFVNIGIPGKYLRRPISVSEYDAESVTLLYDVVGAGTSEMSSWQEGAEVDLLVALGNGFDLSRSGSDPLLLGGGIGIAPLFGLAKALIAKGVRPTVILGFNTGKDVVMLEEFRAVCPTYVATVDGTAPSGPDGQLNVTQGFVTDVIDRFGLGENASYFYACGPLPMLRNLCINLDLPGEVSMEARMGCGFGICMCCSLETKDGARRICKEGPVFRKEELIWK